MNKKLIVIVFLLWSSAYCAFGQANQWGPFDPGALRNDGSNASSAVTVRDNLGLGTMAVATSTDYVATDTFTAHTSATGTAVHGLGTMAAEAATDYVATSALALRIDTGNASFSGDIDVTGDVGAATVNGVAPLTAVERTQALVGSSTVDFAAKDTTLTKTASSSYSIITFKTPGETGNEAYILHAGSNVPEETRRNNLELYSGSPTGSTEIWTANDRRLRVSPSGNVLIATITDDGVNKLQIDGGIRSALPVYADNAAATAGGLPVNSLYRTTAGVVMIVIP